MTKTDGRDAKTAAAQIDESLQRLGTDHLDLIQLHDIHAMEEPDQIFGPGGAMEAVQSAKKAGKVRYVGFTGHKSPEVHLRMLKVADHHNFLFDSCQIPLNVMDAHCESFGQEGAAGADEEKHRRARHEADRRGRHPEKQHGDRAGMPALRDEPAGRGLHHGLRLDADFAPSARRGEKIQAAQRGGNRPLLSRTESAAAKGEFEHYKFAKY